MTHEIKLTGMVYTIKIDAGQERVLFSGIDWGHGVGAALPLWQWNERGVVVAKVPGTTSWVARGESAYTGTEFLVLRILNEPDSDGWAKAQEIVRFPIRKQKGGQA